MVWFAAAAMAGLNLAQGFSTQHMEGEIGDINQDAHRYRAALAQRRADELRERAGQEKAVGQRAAAEDRRQAEFVASRAKALAAASGAGAHDPTMVDIYGDIEHEGEVRALSSLFDSYERARGLEEGAYLAERERDLENWQESIEGKLAQAKKNQAVISGASGAASQFAGAYGQSFVPQPSQTANSGTSSLRSKYNSPQGLADINAPTGTPGGPAWYTPSRNYQYGYY